MELIWEIEQEIATNSINPTVFHVPENKAIVLFTDPTDGRFYLVSANTELGNWENKEFTEPFETAVEPHLQYIRSEILANGYTWVVWKSDNRHRVAMYPYFSVGFNFKPKINGVYLEPVRGVAKVNGKYLEITGGWIKINGEWKEII